MTVNRRGPIASNLESNIKGSHMSKFTNSVKKFLKSEDGPTAVEYAVMLALIIVVCLTAISTVGTSANSKFDEVGNYLT